MYIMYITFLYLNMASIYSLKNTVKKNVKPNRTLRTRTRNDKTDG
jgi:hypothetical protein